GALPGDDERAGSTATNARLILIGRGVCVYLELVAERVAGAVEALGDDAVPAAVLVLALPHHHVTAVVRRTYRRRLLVAARDRRGVDQHPRTDLSAIVTVAHGIDVRISAGGVGLTGDHEVAIRGARHIRRDQIFETRAL